MKARSIRQEYLDGIKKLELHLSWIRNGSVPKLAARMKSDIVRLRLKLLAYDLRQ
jgi:hypothetical protein